MTGTICSHPCQGYCTRNFYEKSVQIRNTKLECAEQAMDAIIDSVSVTGDYSGSVAVSGRWSCRYGSGLLSGKTWRKGNNL